MVVQAHHIVQVEDPVVRYIGLAVDTVRVVALVVALRTDLEVAGLDSTAAEADPDSTAEVVEDLD